MTNHGIKHLYFRALSINIVASCYPKRMMLYENKFQGLLLPNLRPNYENKEGKSPLMLRIFLSGEMSNFVSTKIYVNKSLWDNATSRMKGRTWIMDKPTKYSTFPHCRARLQVQETSNANYNRNSISPYLLLVASIKYCECIYLSMTWIKSAKLNHLSLRLGITGGMHKDDKPLLTFS